MLTQLKLSRAHNSDAKADNATVNDTVNLLPSQQEHERAYCWFSKSVSDIRKLGSDELTRTIMVRGLCAWELRSA
jgi:hypothetical protein